MNYTDENVFHFIVPFIEGPVWQIPLKNQVSKKGCLGGSVG